jgi:hypothetical protein
LAAGTLLVLLPSGAAALLLGLHTLLVTLLTTLFSFQVDPATARGKTLLVLLPRPAAEALARLAVLAARLKAGPAGLLLLLAATSAGILLLRLLLLAYTAALIGLIGHRSNSFRRAPQWSVHMFLNA